jgi:hypothetical protein
MPDAGSADHSSDMRDSLIELAFDTLEHVDEDQRLYSALHGNATRYAAPSAATWMNPLRSCAS